ARLRVPQGDHAVAAAGCQQRAVGMERGPDDGPPMCGRDVESAKFLALLRIPDVDEMVLGPHRQAAAVPTPDDALDDGVFARFLLQSGAEFLERRRVPEPNRAVPGGRGDLRAVGAETRVVDVAGVAAQTVAGLRLLQVPEADGTVIRCRGER